MKRAFCGAKTAVFFLFFLALSLSAADFFVSPSGSAVGDGSIEKPWDIKTAFKQPETLHAGDTLYLRGGLYRFEKYLYSTLTGTDGHPIIVKPYQNERATIDCRNWENTFTIEGGYTDYCDIELTSTSEVRMTSSSGQASRDTIARGGLHFNGPHCKMLNWVIHDTRGSGFWQGAYDSEMYGCIIYNNGWDAPDRGHGHGIYIQNDKGSKLIADCIVFNQFGYGIHAYVEGAEGYLNNIRLEGVVSFNNGAPSIHGLTTNILIGGRVRVASSPEILNCFAYTKASNGGANNLGYSAGAQELIVKDSVFAGKNALTLVKCVNAALTGNIFYGALAGFDAAQYPKNKYYTERPKGVWAYTRRNKYDPSRLTVIVYNWDLKDLVEIPAPAGFLKEKEAYDITDVQNYYGGPVSAGKYNGKTIAVPMNLKKVSAVAGLEVQPEHTAPEFGVFILKKTGNYLKP